MRQAGSNVIVLASGSGAVLLGLGYFFLAEAPLRLSLMNLAALGIGLTLVTIARLLPPAGRQGHGLLLGSAAAPPQR